MKLVVCQKDIHTVEGLTEDLFDEIPERQSVQADIVNFTDFGVVSSKRCIRVILRPKPGEFSPFHVKLFLLCGEVVNVDKYGQIKTGKYGVCYLDVTVVIRYSSAMATYKSVSILSN